MKLSTITSLVIAVFFCSCIEETDAILTNKTNLVIIGTLEYPYNQLTVSVLETSNTAAYEKKILTEATIKLYTRSKNGTESLVTDKFNFQGDKYRNVEPIPVTLGDSYWITISLPDRKGLYRTDPQIMLSPIPIKSIERTTDYYHVVFSDPEEEQNQYIAEFFFEEGQGGYLYEIAVNDDTLFNGNKEAFLEVTFFDPATVYATLANVSPETYTFYKNYLQQKSDNENYARTNEDLADPAILFSTPPAQLKSNFYNADDPDELVLGNFATMAKSEFNQ